MASRIYAPSASHRAAQERFGMALGAAKEIVDFGADLLDRLATRPGATLEDAAILNGPGRQLVAGLDAFVLCLEHGAVPSALVHGRSVLEGCFAIEWVLAGDTERWGRQIIVAGIRRGLADLRRRIPGTSEHTEFVAACAAAYAADPFTHLYNEDLSDLIRDTEAVLADPELEPISSAFESAKGSRRYDPYWYQPNGVTSVAAMARRLGREPEYLSFFNLFSQAAHGTDFPAVGEGVQGAHELAPIRTLDRFPTIFSVGVYIALRGMQALIGHFAPSEMAAFQERFVTCWEARLDTASPTQGDAP